MIAAGVDIIHIPRIAAAIERHGERFLRRVFTPQELAYCAGRTPELAARFAAKEAASKALGVGVRTLSRHGIGWHEAEVVSDPYGKPNLRLYGRAAQLAEALRLGQWALSLAHEREFAIAFVVAITSAAD